ncbi:MAG: hypothetical protein K5865_03035 [Eubacterium sp.]|nr:hypothetical protein [Eubacterium sp.]
MADTDKKTNQNNKPNNQVFRQKTLDRISSPEQLTDYLKVTSPGVWVILITVILLLAGLIVWSTIGNLETTEEVKIMVQSNQAVILSENVDKYKEGMDVIVKDKKYYIEHIKMTEYGYSYAGFETELPDGEYTAEVVTEVVHPINFLIK